MEKSISNLIVPMNKRLYLLYNWIVIFIFHTNGGHTNSLCSSGCQVEKCFISYRTKQKYSINSQMSWLTVIRTCMEKISPCQSPAIWMADTPTSPTTRVPRTANLILLTHTMPNKMKKKVKLRKKGSQAKSQCHLRDLHWHNYLTFQLTGTYNIPLKKIYN